MIHFALPHYQLCHVFPLLEIAIRLNNTSPGHSLGFLSNGCLSLEQVLQLVCLIDRDQVIDETHLTHH